MNISWNTALQFAHAHHAAVARYALFVVYFWFGLLKVFGLSPATPLVHALFSSTLEPIMAFELFNPLFGFFEMFVGVLFLFPRAIKSSAILVGLHLLSTTAPLLLLPTYTWSGMFIPTLEGQYIIKNLLIFSALLTLLAEGKANED